MIIFFTTLAVLLFLVINFLMLIVTFNIYAFVKVLTDDTLETNKLQREVQKAFKKEYISKREIYKGH